MLLTSCASEIVASSTRWWCMWGGVSGYVCVYKYQLAPCCSKTPSGSYFWELSCIFQGCGSDAEAEQVFKMEATQFSPRWSRGRIPPPPPQRKQSMENGRYCTSPLARYCKYTGWATVHRRTHTLVHLHTKHPWFIHFTTVDLIWPDKLFNVWRSAALMEKGLFRVCIHQSFGFSTCWSVFRCVVAAIAWSSLTAHSKHTWVWRSLLQQQREASLCSPNPPRRHFLSRSRRKRRDFPPSSVRRGLGRWLCWGRPGPRRLVFPPVAANPSSDVVLSQVRLLLASILDPWGGGARPHHLPRLS